MFAIIITEENMPKIAEFVNEADRPMRTIAIYLASKPAWYFVRGYVDPRGAVRDFGILSEYSLKDNFEYDEEKIKTDWDQIVRK